MRKLVMYASLLMALALAIMIIHRHFDSNRSIQTIYNACLPANSTIIFVKNDITVSADKLLIPVDTNYDDKSDIILTMPGYGSVTGHFLFLHGAHPEKKIIFERIGTRKNGTHTLEYGIQYAK